ncbi:MAG: DUF2029 domain-containing protein [Candidatus Eremiobacteraeota bacterium]|nr:DUF2029 domain-containing protein [Candidatus Eremiobacteraeota bacterium]
MPSPSASNQPTPPVFSLLGYLAVGFLTLLLPECSLSDAQVIDGRYATIDFLKTIFFTLLAWVAITAWWVHGFYKLKVKDSIPGEWLGHALAGLVPLALLAAWCKPFLSVDTTYYVAYGRQLAVLGLNPYQVNLYASETDPIISQVSHMWFGTTALFGPVALALYAVPNLLVPNPQLLQLATVLKFLWLPFYFSLGALVLAHWSDDENRLTMALAVVANPILLWLGLVDGHVDILITLFMALTAYLMSKDRPEWSAVALSLAASLKLVAIVVLPVCFFWWLSQSVRKALRFSAVFVALYGGLYLAVRGGEYLAVIEFTKNWDNLVAANLVPALLNRLHLELHQVQRYSNLVFYATVAAVCWPTWRGRFEKNPALPMGLAMGGLVLTRTYFQPWYTLWFWPLLWFACKDFKSFYQQLGLWTLTVLFTWFLPWTIKGYLVGLATLIALAHAVRVNRPPPEPA